MLGLPLVYKVARVAHDGQFDAHARDKLSLYHLWIGRGRGPRRSLRAGECGISFIAGTFPLRTSPLPHFWFSFLVGSHLLSDYSNAIMIFSRTGWQLATS